MHEGHRQRLLDKVMKDCSVLAEHEILEALLFYAIPRRNTNETAKLLLDACGGTIRSVLDADMQVLTSVDGVGLHTAAYLKLLGVVLEEYSTKKIERIKISNFHSIKEYLINFFAGSDQEYFVIFFVNNKNEIIHTIKLTDNSHRFVNIDLAELTKSISLLKPNGVFLAHNHPSGNPTPSSEDDLTTGRIYYLLALNKISLIDHVIIGAGGESYSYYHSGKLDRIKELSFI